jgi:uncharacterized protein YbdZ (MbtH family)
MSKDGKDDLQEHRVVVNAEEQYSIWPLDRELPQGWFEAGKSGPVSECLAYIAEVWTDMRPLSLRQHMASMPASGAQTTAEGPAESTDTKHLIDRLAGDQSVEFWTPLADRARALKESLDRGFVLIRFLQTTGVTELAMSLDRDASKTEDTDFKTATGRVQFAGDLTLDWRRARCVVSLDLGTMQGTGHLEPVFDQASDIGA